jgi:hypothetical protein
MRNLLSLLAAVGCVISMAAAPSTRPSIDEKCRKLADHWHERFAAEGLTYVVSPPFVVAGDGGLDRLNRYTERTIHASAEALHRKFFDRQQPTEPVLILLFESAEPYERLAKKWFGQKPSTPYGYFRSRDNIMVMNVSTGTGTLVHELTHALIRPDFPEVPDWFNEGLGSLFEQCTLENGDIRGLENWRLPALQRVIKQDKLRPLDALLKDDDFYSERLSGPNYAQARYLLMYLQQEGKLTNYYKKFRANHADDPTGLKTLEAAIAPLSLDAFEEQWRAWVRGLRFDR